MLLGWAGPLIARCGGHVRRCCSWGQMLQVAQLWAVPTLACLPRASYLREGPAGERFGELGWADALPYFLYAPVPSSSS
jgi:hypothetical protein